MREELVQEKETHNNISNPHTNVHTGMLLLNTFDTHTYN